jgi:4-hydroxybenzoate-CoA ligase/benzoate-CoA ligase
VLKSGQKGDEALTKRIQDYIKTRLAPYKYPRWVEYLPELPKTATGKIQRYKLRF